jgi:hypothetical protein
MISIPARVDMGLQLITETSLRWVTVRMEVLSLQGREHFKSLIVGNTSRLYFFRGSVVFLTLFRLLVTRGKSALFGLRYRNLVFIHVLGCRLGR